MCITKVRILELCENQISTLKPRISCVCTLGIHILHIGFLKLGMSKVGSLKPCILHVRTLEIRKAQPAIRQRNA